MQTSSSSMAASSSLPDSSCLVPPEICPSSSAIAAFPAILLAGGEHALQFALETTGIDQVRGELLVDQLVPGDGIRSFGQFEAQAAQLLFVLRAGCFETAGEVIVGLLRLAQRCCQSVDLPVCLIDGFRELPGLLRTCRYFRVKADASRAQALDIELQPIDRFGLYAEFGLEILYYGIAITDGRDLGIERHGVEVEVRGPFHAGVRVGILPGRRFEFGARVYISGD
jgi:hypothetical protein